VLSICRFGDRNSILALFALPLSMTYSSSSRRALIVQNQFSPFGKKLVQQGYASHEQMQQALAECRKEGKALVEVLQGITGKALTPELVRQYKKQQLFELKILYGIESLDPEITEFSPSEISQLIGNLIPLEVCRNYRLVPLSQNREANPPTLLVAMVDPENLEALDALGRILRPQSISLRRVVVTLEDYQQLISQFLDDSAERRMKIDPKTGGRVLSAGDLELGTFVYEDLVDADPEADDTNLESALNEAEAAPIVATVNKILAKALTDGASDIHVEPQEDFLKIRFRKDGVLQEPFPHLPKQITPAIVSRFKIIAELDIAERRLPQDGRIRRKFQGRNVDFRVSTLPSRFGEKVVLRILDNSATQLGLDKLISEQEILDIVREMAARPFGLILVTGPTGSGKSTTLYSVLAERNDPRINICTAEDPIEYGLPGITQVQVIREKGMDFAAILRSFLRQDPDVILVGETRDKETAKTAIEAALTGHLVLTTLHTNDAAGAIARLDEMGVEPFMVSGALLGVVAQRLMRRVCSECRIPYQPSREELARFGLSASQGPEQTSSDLTFYKANVLTTEEIQKAKAENHLCPKCSGSGYKGRCGVYEVMRISENVQNLITQGAPTERIKEAAVEEGMITLLAYSLRLVRQGATTFDEVERVTFTDTGLESELRAKRKISLECRVCHADVQPEWLDCLYCGTPRFQQE
jgi:type IV pilus assembly protein PilB